MMSKVIDVLYLGADLADPKICRVQSGLIHASTPAQIQPKFALEPSSRFKRIFEPKVCGFIIEDVIFRCLFANRLTFEAGSLSCLARQYLAKC